MYRTFHGIPTVAREAEVALEGALDRATSGMPRQPDVPLQIEGAPLDHVAASCAHSGPGGGEME
jgi:hypothetical protein